MNGNSDFNIYDLIWSSGQCIDSNGEILYYATISPDAGRAVLQNAQARHFGPTQSRPPSGNRSAEFEDRSRGYRDRRFMIDYAVVNSMCCSTTLTYEGPAPLAHDCAQHFTNWLRRIRRHGVCPWIEVLEAGEVNGRLHHHVLLPEDLTSTIEWPHGLAYVDELEDVQSIRRTATYMSNSFFLPADERPRRRRYRRSIRAGINPTVEHFVGTLHQIEQQLEELGVDSPDWTVHQDVDFCERTLEWDPTCINP